MNIIILICSFYFVINAQTFNSSKFLKRNDYPAHEIRINEGFQFIGYLNFEMYEAAYVEIFLYARLEGNVIKSLLRLQYESYLDDNHYTYKISNPNDSLMIGGRQFMLRYQIKDYQKSAYPGSETDHILKLLDQKHLDIGANKLAITYIHVHSDMRKEILVQYSEDLDSRFPEQSSFDKNELSDSWKNAFKWLSGNAKNQFKIKFAE